MFEGTIVNHQIFGEGVIERITEDRICIAFSEAKKELAFPMCVGDIITSVDEAFIQYAVEKKKQKKVAKLEHRKKFIEDHFEKRVTSVRKNNGGLSRKDSDYITPLLGKRSMDIHFSSEEDFFESLGYLAKPGVIGFYQAEIPDDERVQIFEKRFPGQPYKIIKNSIGSNGMKTKQGCQFRINLSSIANCPNSLKKEIGEEPGPWAGRINRSSFALKLVDKYGFQFGYTQDYDEILKSIPEKYKTNFTKGYER